MVMKLEPKIYMVGAHALGMDKARRAVRNFPNPPKGDKIALMRPPMLFPLSNPASHVGTLGAEAANITPRK
ncbi:hypothetical protein PHLCEN_2v9870 [Hermanssonia centrifuga]|uniref:Uncharacterized protein n=1 Tax=Hermanssonia centrifuga TaxID=98765 RepID=A0A1U7KFP6_9APHY|nr:hypothetical protein PHLCEN_2v9870 [Hermanssonia centrifuga]